MNTPHYINSMFKAYKFRMYPSHDQKIFLNNHFGACRFVYNHFLDLRNKKYTQTGKGMSYYDMSSYLTQIKRSGEYPWLNGIIAQSLQQSIMHLDTAFKRFFKHQASYPNFKSRRNAQSFQIPQYFSVNDNHIMIPKLNTPIRIFMHRSIEGEIQSLTISKNPSGKYYVSVLVETAKEEPEAEPINNETATGIDLGLKAFITTSDRKQIKNPKNLIHSEKKLKKRQRQLSKKEKGSKNSNKARIKVARIHEHIANQRRDFHHKVSCNLTDRYNTIVMEDLNIDGMNKNHRLAKSIGDAGWSSFITMLKAKALQKGKNVIEIGTFEPSSKMCSNCGNIKHDLKLSDRIYHCEICNHTMDRDLNAAINIKRFGMIRSEIPTDSGELTPVGDCVRPPEYMKGQRLMKHEAHVL